ncbi:ParB/RepB/Spo0J family partition protein [Ruminococcus sp. Marseille-P6503]|uniref:ParB/RepB/Spo0J family partition protein n=1 Tax=Ruminococcus sp. Marseille-P6503 TaxID=2364796 RepID=UPI000F52CBB4|nr:ParB/RepB/Spo0J family partition protein [Ruminococcus sp. Marseille-P6503]
MAKKERLKNGLDSLFEDNFGSAEESGGKSTGVEEIRLSLIEPDRNQPRSDFDEARLNELADNIRQHGVLQPILVRPAGEDRYMIVAGERRWRAARIAGLSEIPALVRELSDLEAAQIALIENIQREDLNPIEEAKAFKRLSDEFGMTQEDIARIVGKSRSAVTNSIRLLKLIPEVQEAVADKQISIGHAKILCGVEDQSQQHVLMLQALAGRMTVRQFEEHVDNVVSGRYIREAEEKEARKTERKKPKKVVFGDSEEKMLLEARTAIYSELGIAPDFKRAKNGVIVMEMEFGNDEMFKDFLKRLC